MNGDRLRALYTYAGSTTDLSFREGDVLTVDSISSDGWYTGSIDGGSHGVFPVNYTELIKPEEFVMSINCLSLEERVSEGSQHAIILCKISTNRRQLITEKTPLEFAHLSQIVSKYYSYIARSLPDLSTTEVDLSVYNIFLNVGSHSCLPRAQYLLQCPSLLSVVVLWLRSHFVRVRLNCCQKHALHFYLEQEGDAYTIYCASRGVVETKRLSDFIEIPTISSPLSGVHRIPELSFGAYVPSRGYERCKQLTVTHRVVSELTERGQVTVILEKGPLPECPAPSDTVVVSYKGFIWCPSAMVILEFECFSNVSVVLGQGRVVSGLEYALSHMSCSERDLVFLSPRYAYGHPGCADKGVPSRGYLIYDVTLHRILK